jgi:shikimate dehydrogenase
VNTLCFQNGQILGDNTDGAGMLRDLLRHWTPPARPSVLLLGAGGAARGVLGPLLDLAPAKLHIANRSAAKASELCALFARDPAAAQCELSAGGLDDLPTLGSFDLLVNATSAGHGDRLTLPNSLLAPSSFGYDLSYGPAAAPFLEWLSAGQCAGVDGLGMLVEQAALAFQRWHGHMPDTAPVLRALKLA